MSNKPFINCFGCESLLFVNKLDRIKVRLIPADTEKDVPVMCAKRNAEFNDKQKIYHFPANVLTRRVECTHYSPKQN